MVPRVEKIVFTNCSNTEIELMVSGNFTFDGEVSIIVNIHENTNNITLHSLNLSITDWHVFKLSEPVVDESYSREEEVSVLDTSQDLEKEFFILHFENNVLEKGSRFKVYIKYIGYINDHLEGFYRSSYKIGQQTRYVRNFYLTTVMFKGV